MAIVILILLLLVNAVLVMAELAVVSAKRVRLEHMAEKGDRGARAALELGSSPLRFLSTVQIGITAIAILSGAFGERSMAKGLAEYLAAFPWLAPYAEVASLIVVVAGITFFSLVVGELIPKRLALAHPEAIARVVSRPSRLAAKLASPLVALLSGSAEGTLKLFGFRENKEHDVSEEEIRGMIEKGTQSGVILEAEQELVERVFRLGDQRVGELMVSRADITWIDAQAGVERVRLVVATSPHSHFPVCEGSLDTIVGVVHVKDLVKHGMIAGDAISLRELARPPVFVPEATPAIRLLERFREARTHVMFVVDEFGGVKGLVTLNDLVERVMGDAVLLDTGEQPQVVQRADGTLLVDGRLPAADFWREVGVEPPPQDELADVNTTGGLVVALMGHLPRVGETVERFGLRIEVVDMDRRRVDQVLVTPPTKPPHAEEGGE